MLIIMDMLVSKSESQNESQNGTVYFVFIVSFVLICLRLPFTQTLSINF